MKFGCPYHGSVEVPQKPILWTYDSPDCSQKHMLEFFCHECNDVVRFYIDPFNADAIALMGFVVEKDWTEDAPPLTHDGIPEELEKFRRDIDAYSP